MFYVLTKGKVPIVQKNRTKAGVQDMLQNIVHGQISYNHPVFTDDHVALLLVEGLLTSNPENRLSPQQVLEHAWLRDIDLGIGASRNNYGKQPSREEYDRCQKILEQNMSGGGEDEMGCFGDGVRKVLNRIGSISQLDSFSDEQNSCV
jgi:serine/threonine protein kinase